MMQRIIKNIETFSNKVRWEELPCLTFGELGTIKRKKSCVYFFVSKSRGLLYIGSCDCLYKRWFDTPHKCSALAGFLNDCLIYYLECDKYLIKAIEHRLIFKNNPPYNREGIDNNKPHLTKKISDFLEWKRENEKHASNEAAKRRVVEML